MRPFRFVFCCLIATSCTTSQAPDLIIYNAVVYTVNDSLPKVEAFGVKNGRITAIGTTDNLVKTAGKSTRLVDASGKTVTPGFIEGHGHFLGMGRNQLILDLSKAATWDEIVRMVETASRETKPGTWILGRGWHQEKWQQKPERLAEGYPTHHELSKRVPDHPVLLTHVSGHADIVNQKAMMEAGVRETTPDPENGQLVRESNGKPAGVFLGAARAPLQGALRNWRNTLSKEQLIQDEIKAAELAAQECLAHGVTSFHDAGSTFLDIRLLKSLAEKEKLGVRLYVMIREPLDTLKKYAKETRMVGYGNDFLTVQAFKLSLDGALGARSAWMIEPYSDVALKTGIPYFPGEYFEAVSRLALELNYQMCTHAIGDRANRETLSIYEKLLAENPGKDLRWRIEHAQHLHPDDIPRFGKSGIIASIQAVHCTSDGPWVPVRIGQRRSENGAYRWRDLIDTQALIVNGTDAPVEPVDPVANFAASVTRRMTNGELFFPDQAMTREEALRSMTLNPAYAAFEEKSKGRIAVGAWADFIVLSDNIMEADEAALRNTTVLETWIAGQQVFKKN
jgi:predicted amidohydrolase YtcJ